MRTLPPIIAVAGSRSLLSRGLFRGALLLALCFVFVGAANSLQAQAPAKKGEAPKLTPLPHPEVAPPALPQEPKPILPIVGAIFGVFVALTVLILLVIWRMKVRPPKLVSPATIAIKRLTALKAELSTLAPPEAAGRVSIILREFQEAGFAVPAPYLTSDELYHQPDGPLADAVRERFGPVADLYDRLSFARKPATKEEAEALIQTAMQAVSEVKLVQAPPLPPPANPPL
jgi:hypothetical protein